MSCSHQKRYELFETESPAPKGEGKERGKTKYIIWFCPSCHSVTSTAQNNFVYTKNTWEKTSWVNPRLKT